MASPLEFIHHWLSTNPGLPSRVYHGVAPEAELSDHLTYILVGGVGSNNLKGTIDSHVHDVQIDCWSQSSKRAANYAACVNNLDGFIGTRNGVKVRYARMDSERSDIDTTTSRLWHRYTFTFSLITGDN